MGRLDGGAEDAGQIADALGDQEIMLHQPLDAEGPGMVGIADAPRQLGLQIEGQALLRPSGEIVQMAAHGPEEGGRLLEGRHLGGAQHPAVDQGGDLIHLIEIFGDPVEGMEVAQASLALLDVGLQRIARIAGALVALVALGELGLDEVEAVAGGDLAPEAALQLLEQLRIAPEEAGFQQPGADGHIRLGLADALVHRAGGMADLEAQIPEAVEHELHHLLAMGRQLVGQQEQEIDIRAGGELAPAIAAHRHQGQMLAGAGIGQREDLLGGVVVEGADQLIHQEAGLAPDAQAGILRPGLRLEAPADLHPALGQRPLQHLQQGRIPLGPGIGEAGGEAPAVDDGALIADGLHGAASYGIQGPRCKRASGVRDG